MVRHLWWSLLGIAELETLDSVDTPTVVLVRVLYGAYLIVAAILLINLMIALLSNTYQRVEDNSLKEWSFKKAITIQTCSSLHPIPVPFNLVSNIVMAVAWLFVKCTRGCLFRHMCRGCVRRPYVSNRKVDYVVKDLQDKYFATHGNSFPLTEEGKIDKVVAETEGNTQIANHIAQRAFKSQQDVLPTGPKAWQSMGLQVKDCLLVYEGAKFCLECQRSSTANLHHGARYTVPFSREFPQFEVLVLGTGNSRFLDVGVVWREHDPHSRPGYHTGSVGYHGNGDVLDGGDAELSSAVDAPVVNRGDLIGCSIMFDLKRSGKVQVVFNLNGKQITEKELWIEHNQNEKRLYPFVGMGEEGVQVLAKMVPAEHVDGREQTDFLSEDVSDTRRRVPFAEASDGEKASIHRELDESLAKFRQLRNNILANFRYLEDLFDDRHRELTKIASVGGRQENKVILSKLDKKELECSNMVKKIKQDLDELGEMTNTKFRAFLSLQESGRA